MTTNFARNGVIFKPGFHIVVSVVSVMSVVRKKIIGQIQLYGNLQYKCSIQKKRQIQLVVRDRMNSICPMNFFRTTDTTDTTIWKPGLSRLNSTCLGEHTQAKRSNVPAPFDTGVHAKVNYLRGSKLN